MNKIPLIIRREYLSRVKKKSFIIMTILGPLLMAGLALSVIWMNRGEDDYQKILLVDETPQLFMNLHNTENIKFDYVSDLKLTEAKRLFQQSDYTAILYFPANILSGNHVDLFFKQQPSFTSQQIITNKIESVIEKIKLEKNNISKETYLKIRTHINLSTIRIKKEGVEETVDKEATFVGYFFAILIYLFIFMYGVQVLRGVSEEKTNRIVEIIISSVKPFQLMMGKIIGVALVGLTQFALWIVLTFALTGILQSVLFSNYYSPVSIQKTLQMTTQMKHKMDTENTSTDFTLKKASTILNRINFPFMLSMFLFYFMGGYLLYGSMFAAIGAAVDNDTDTQQFMLPITLPLILALVVANIIVQNPEGQLAFWFSIIPFTSPIVMLVRLAIGVGDGGIPIWEVGLSMTLLILCFIFTTWVAAKIYRVGILIYGKKVNYRELWKWLTY